jgi:hypothetical protein
MDFSKLAALAGGHAEARAIQVALKLGLFEALANTERDAAGLARALECDRHATSLLANALVALGLIAKRAEHYSLTESAQRFLVESSSEYLGGMILLMRGCGARGRSWKLH